VVDAHMKDGTRLLELNMVCSSYIFQPSAAELEENSDEAERSKKATSSGRRMNLQLKILVMLYPAEIWWFSQKNIPIAPSGALRGKSNTGQEPVSFNDIVGEPGPKTTYDVAIFASNSFKKMKSENKKSSTNKKNSRQQDSGSEREKRWLTEFLLLVPSKNINFRLRQILYAAFAGKLETLNEENPEPEKPTLVPGWGQWTHIQKKKGLPSWMVEEHAIAQKKREDALKERKIHISSIRNVPGQAEKLHTPTVPYPFTSKEQYEIHLRVPLGPDFNPATKVGALIRPDVSLCE
ncbi:hypothetical protein MKW92_039515, partial [Papaver armeniacum]